MRAVWAAALTCLVLATATVSAAAAPWRITKTSWSAADERGFGDFVRAIGQSGCDTTIGCLRSPANPYRASDPKSLRFIADCADLPYMLRAYYAWKNGLPFTYVNGVTGHGGDIRYSSNPNRPVSRRSLVDRGRGLNAVAILSQIHRQVSTATYRTDPAREGRVLSDFYAPKIQPGTIRAGSVVYDINGHVALIYNVEPDGRAQYMDASPDYHVNRSAFGPQFGQSPRRLGGGLKNWRPFKLVGAHRTRNGHYIGGHMVMARNDDIADYSLEQYTGNVAGAHADGAGALFQYNGLPLGYYEFVRVELSGGKTTFNPIYELQATMQTLCENLQERAQYVNIAIKSGIQKRPEPARLPYNIYGSADAQWEAYSTPSRDARIKGAFAQFYQDLDRMVLLWQARDPRIVYDGVDLKADLQKVYVRQAKACTVRYTNSAGHTVSLDFDQLDHRLFTMSFDPYHCIERRWGATDPRELASCRDGPQKTRWYKAEQRLRNQIERTYDLHMGYSLAQLEAHARGTGPADPPPVDIKHLIDTIGQRKPFTPMKPVGF